MSEHPRVRFAPSPTGYLHIGGVRTALFNWLWARKNHGTFVLRIEDTDQERSTPQSMQVILDSMRWLGLDWDEGPEVGGPNGPYFQMQRLHLYREYADKLIASKRAYRCYCTKEELAAAREKLKQENPKANFVYPGTCRDRTDHPDRPHVVRFNMKGVNRETTTYRDLVFGEVTTPNSAQQDFVMLRSDGVPLYNFGVVIDDLTMGITLVMRGRDHMVNTPPQILLYEALECATPAFAHLPMMLAPSGEKLSKRHGAVSVGEYETNGFLPMGVLNYLARFGWSHGDQEIFSRGDLIDKFDLEHLGRPDGRFDAKKFADVNFEHLKEERLTDLESYARQVLPFLAKRGLDAVDPGKLRAAIPTIRQRARTLIEAAEALDFYLRDKPVYDPAAVKKVLTPECVDNLEAVAGAIESIDKFDQPGIEAAIQALLTARGLQMKAIAQPARVALTGKTASPGLYELMEVLGREACLARLRAGIELARGGRS
ncbi:MAG: glutamate--tRNA ligase [Deltaproteobacteria bacterium]|nr:glutamate--tRNA ligase [Deltaproteobacteria bacterium]